MTTIFEYVNYRFFLKDFLAGHKEQGRLEFSQKMILMRLGISSTGFLSNVISGKKNLTPAQIARLIKILKLKKNEGAYFESLVFFNQAKTIEAKNEFLSRLKSLQKVTMRLLDTSTLSRFSKWYYVVIRELLNFYAFHDGNDIKLLAAMIDPPLKPAQAQEALADLERMGLVRKDELGRYRQVDSALSTGDEVRSLLVVNYQLDSMDLGKRALVKIPAAERDISALTMTLSEKNFQILKKELQMLRKRFSKAAVEDAAPEAVYQLNIQFFPITKKRVGGKEDTIQGQV
jgi:uncharacterized protein (TIGR02147 family)